MLTIRYAAGVLWITSLMTGGSQARLESFVKKQIGFIGNYYAGHGEFPWVVEIRHRESENWDLQEFWAVGNLIGPRYVLSTCNAVANFYLSETAKDRYLVMPKKPEQFKVMYSPDYPYYGQTWYLPYVGSFNFHRHYNFRPYSTELKTGTREITRMSPHPFCNPNSLRYFWGIAELGNQPIGPFRLFINYAPAELDATLLFRKWYALKHKSIWTPALMSAWGRDYSDKYSKQTMLFNYKLKYLIQYREWAECAKIASVMGWSTWNKDLLWENNTFCMSLHDPDNTIGAICDHDRGAAIVWDGYFIGVVVTGAKFENCSNLNPLPFVVQSLEDALIYWTNVERHILSYFIPKNTHLFPGLTGEVITFSDSQPLTASKALVILTFGFLLIVNFGEAVSYGLRERV